MSRFRCLLVPLTAAWLSVHVMLIAGTAIVWRWGSSPSDVVCTCAHETHHGACPVHGGPGDGTRCRLQGTQEDVATALMSLLGPLVLPATAVVAIVVASSSRPIGGATPLRFDWILPPEPPPPRG